MATLAVPDGTKQFGARVGMGRQGQHMGSVNNASAPLPSINSAPAPQQAGWDLGDGLTAMGTSLFATSRDLAAYTGALGKDGTPDLETAAGFAAVTAGPTAFMALRNPLDPLTGAPMRSTSFGERLGAQAAGNTIRVTPTLISAIAGPAIADGITMIAPNLVKKYKDTKEIKDAKVKKETEKQNQTAKISRAVAGGVAVGLAAGVVFLLKPNLFKKFQSTQAAGGLVDRAIRGTTQYAVNGGPVQKLTGVLSADQIRSTLTAIGAPLLDGDSVKIVKTVAPMAKDAVFSNRAVLGSAGALGTFLLANNAAGQEDPERRKLMWGITAAAGAMTVGATYGIGKLTQRSMLANSGAGGLLAKNELFMKPNIEWVKKYATTIAPITAIPAGTSASQYYNLVDDFDDITSSRSPFRK